MTSVEQKTFSWIPGLLFICIMEVYGYSFLRININANRHLQIKPHGSWWYSEVLWRQTGHTKSWFWIMRGLLTCSIFRPTNRNPRCSKRLMTSPISRLWTPSGFTAIKVRSLMPEKSTAGQTQSNTSQFKYSLFFWVIINWKAHSAIYWMKRRQTWTVKCKPIL